MGILKNLTITSAGALAFPPAQLKKWTEAHSGRWVSVPGPGTTHVIASKDAWKKKTDTVRAALDAGAWVVSYDWLEDSLQRGRRLAEKRYEWTFLRQQRKMRREMARLGEIHDAKKFVDGCEEVRKATGSGTSKSQSKPKPKPRSKSFFFSDGTITPFVSAAEDLARRRAERKTAAGNEDTPATSASASSDRNTTSSQDSQSLSPGSSPAETFSLPPSAAASHAPVAGTPASSSSIISVSAGQDAKKPSLKDLYHFYLDSSGFEYKTMLVRTNYYANNMARYRLSILESHAKPHVYCTFVEYMPPTGSVLRVGGGGGVDEAELRRTLEGFNKSTGSHEATQPSPMPTYGTAVQPPTPTSSSSPPAEVTRLHTLITPPIPSSTAPYKALVAPQHSTFAAAWLAFRHTFRDLTLLSWEERFDESKTLQKARAQHFGVEPFVYIKPKPALPVGLRTQNPALFQGQTLCRDRDPKGGETPNDDGYVFNRFNLPGLVQPLQRGGAIGSVLLREADERRAWDAARVRDNAKKVDWRYRPLFNGVTGRPQKQGGGRPMGMRR